MTDETVQVAHADSLAALPARCNDCGRTGIPLHLLVGEQDEVLLCGHCAEHPDHQHTAGCPAARCCGQKVPGIKGKPLRLCCQLCPHSPTYWRNPQ
jgi:hypothetical protein